MVGMANASAGLDRQRQWWARLVVARLVVARLVVAGLLMSANQVLAADNGATVSNDQSKATGIGAGAEIVKKTCEPAEFKTAELVRSGDRIVLKVAGEAPHAGMSIEVRPVLYVMHPDYWLMSLVACVPEGTTATGPAVAYAVEINVAGSVGNKGIDLSGKGTAKSKRLEAPN